MISVFIMYFLAAVSGLETGELEAFESSKAILMFNPLQAGMTIKETIEPLGLFEDEIMEGEEPESSEEILFEEPQINAAQEVNEINQRIMNLSEKSSMEDEDTKQTFEKIGLYVFFGVLGGLAILYEVLRVIEKFTESRRNRISIYKNIIQRI